MSHLQDESSASGSILSAIFSDANGETVGRPLQISSQPQPREILRSLLAQPRSSGRANQEQAEETPTEAPAQHGRAHLQNALKAQPPGRLDSAAHAETRFPVENLDRSMAQTDNLTQKMSVHDSEANSRAEQSTHEVSFMLASSGSSYERIPRSLIDEEAAYRQRLTDRVRRLSLARLGTLEGEPQGRVESLTQQSLTAARTPSATVTDVPGEQGPQAKLPLARTEKERDDPSRYRPLELDTTETTDRQIQLNQDALLDIDGHSEIERSVSAATPVSQASVLNVTLGKASDSQGMSPDLNARSGQGAPVPYTARPAAEPSVSSQYQRSGAYRTPGARQVPSLPKAAALQELQAIDAEIQSHELRQALELAREAQMAAEKECSNLRELFTAELDEIEKRVELLTLDRDEYKRSVESLEASAARSAQDMRALSIRLKLAESRTTELEARLIDEKTRSAQLMEMLEAERKLHAQKEHELQALFRESEEATAKQLEKQAKLMQELRDLLATKEQAIGSATREPRQSSRNSSVNFAHQKSSGSTPNDLLNGDDLAQLLNSETSFELDKSMGPQPSQVPPAQPHSVHADVEIRSLPQATSASAHALQECIEEMSRTSARLAAQLSLTLDELHRSRQNESALNMSIQDLRSALNRTKLESMQRFREVSMAIGAELRQLKTSHAQALHESERRFQLLSEHLNRVNELGCEASHAKLVMECVNKDLTIESLRNQLSLLKASNAANASQQMSSIGTAAAIEALARPTSRASESKAEPKSKPPRCSTAHPHIGQSRKTSHSHSSATARRDLKSSTEKQPRASTTGLSPKHESATHQLDEDVTESPEARALLEVKIARLEAELEIKSKALAELDKLSQQWKARSEELEKALAVSEHDRALACDALREAESKSHNCKCATTEKELEEKLREERQSAASEIRSLRILLSKRNTALDATRAHEQALLEQLKAAQAQVAKLEQQVAARGRLADMRGKRLESLEAAIRSHTEDDSRSRSIVRALKDKIKDLSDECVRREMLIENLRERLERATTQTQEKEREVQNEASHVKSLTAQVSKLRAESASRKQQLDALRDSLSSLLANVERTWANALENPSEESPSPAPSHEATCSATKHTVDDAKQERSLCAVCEAKRADIDGQGAKPHPCASAVTDECSSLRARISRINQVLERMHSQIQEKDKQLKTLRAALVVTRKSAAGMASSVFFGQASEGRKYVSAALARVERCMQWALRRIQSVLEARVRAAIRSGQVRGAYLAFKMIVENESVAATESQDFAFRLLESLIRIQQLATGTVAEVHAETQLVKSTGAALEAVAQNGLKVLAELDRALEQAGTEAHARLNDPSDVAFAAPPSDDEDEYMKEISGTQSVDEQRLIEIFADGLARGAAMPWQQQVAAALEEGEVDLNPSASAISRTVTQPRPITATDQRLNWAYNVEPRLSPSFWGTLVERSVKSGFEANPDADGLPDTPNDLNLSLGALVHRFLTHRVKLAEIGSTLAVHVAFAASRSIPTRCVAPSGGDDSDLLESVKALAQTLRTGGIGITSIPAMSQKDLIETALDAVGLLTIHDDPQNTALGLGASTNAGSVALHGFLAQHKQLDDAREDLRNTIAEVQNQAKLQKLAQSEYVRRDVLERALTQHNETSKQLDVARHVIAKLRQVVECCVCNAGQRADDPYSSTAPLLFKTHPLETPNPLHISTQMPSQATPATRVQSGVQSTRLDLSGYKVSPNNEGADVASDNAETSEDTISGSEDSTDDLVALSRALNDIGMGDRP